MRLVKPPEMTMCNPLGNFLAKGLSKNRIPGDNRATHAGNTVHPVTIKKKRINNPIPSPTYKINGSF